LKRILLILMALIACGTIGATLTVAADYNYITALNDRLAADSPMIIIDICTVEQFAKGHIKGSIETNTPQGGISALVVILSS